MRANQVKCCTTQHLDAEEPSSEWDVDRLGSLAAKLNKSASEQETCLAIIYWQLGQTLSLARCNFNHGQWNKFLSERDIEKSRASRAVAIFRHFPQKEDVNHLTVKHAYAARKRMQKQETTARREEGARDEKPPTPVESSRPSRTLKAHLSEIIAMSPQFFQEVESATQAEAADLLCAIEQVWERFGELHELVKKQLSHCTDKTQ